jgi:NitT/TauT family transport system ATP-binding protein
MDVMIMYAIRHITKEYEELRVLDDITIEFGEYKTTVILGPSGCGKTTLLNMVSGLSTPDSGEVEGFQYEKLSFVFQESRLIPWRTVGDNIRFVLKGKMDKDKLEWTVDRYLGQFGLKEYIDYYPSKLSGGMKQRIGMLRAFAYPSEILLMDEPFRSLDIANKRHSIDFLKELLNSEKRTCILVTHDLDEAIELGDKIVILTDKPTRVKKVITNMYLLDGTEESRVKARKMLETEVLSVNCAVKDSKFVCEVR